jgi:predicted alpha/beta hydrolase
MLALLLGMVGLSFLFPAHPTSAAPRQRCFAETGYCVSGPILTYWQGNGGLSVFGYPISSLNIEAVENWSGPVQWFERDRLEDHGQDGVLAG